MDDKAMHLPLLDFQPSPAAVSPAQARGVAQAAARPPNGESFMLAMPAEPPSGVWDVEIHLQCGRGENNGLPILGGPNFLFRAGLNAEQKVDFLQAVLPPLSTALEIASMWDLSEHGKSVMQAYRRANMRKVIGMLACMLGWLGCMLTCLIGATLDPPISPAFWFGIGGGVGVLAIIATAVTNVIFRRAAKIADEWVVEASQKLHKDLTQGRAAGQLLRAGLFIARGDPEWRPSKICCNRVSRLHFIATFPGPVLKVSQLRSSEVVTVPMLSRRGRPLTQPAHDSEPSFDDDPGMAVNAPRDGVVAVHGANTHAEDPLNRGDDPVM